MNVKTKVLITLMIILLSVGFSGSGGQAEEKQEGIIERFSRMLGSSSGLRDFLPKAGSVARYEGIRVYKSTDPPGLTGKITGITYLDWDRSSGKETMVAVYKEEERIVFLGIEILQPKELIRLMKATKEQLVLISTRVKVQRKLKKIENKLTYNPPRIMLQWPFRNEKGWDQTGHLTISSKDGTSKTNPYSSSTIVKGPETLYTKAGKFSAWRVEKTQPNGRATFWWAKRRWIIKWELDTPSVSESGEMVEFKESER